MGYFRIHKKGKKELTTIMILFFSVFLATKEAFLVGFFHMPSNKKGIGFQHVFPLRSK